jgi:VWFA-related protein
MRMPVLLLLFVTAGAPLFAARTVSVAQLEQQLAALRGKPDADAAWSIADMELNERLNPARLAQFENEVAGEKSRQALMALAADSAFLAQPAAELPAIPAPNLAEQKRMMGQVASYVARALPQLPNFVATRVTSRYEDTPLIQQPGAPFIPYEPMHPTGSDSVQVVYEGGRETLQLHAKNRAAQGLTTWGVFGPILFTVLLDAAQSKLAWSRWEQEPDGLRAVFSYAVPREKSHYEVNYCCVAQQAGSAAANVRPFRQFTAYHGEIAVDPATGIIRRLVLQAELKSDDPITRADILVDYGPVDIAGRAYICPLRSISRSRAQGVQVDPLYHYALANQVQPLRNSLNVVRFTEYHVFRGDTRMLTEDAPPPPAPTVGATPPVPTESTAAPAAKENAPVPPAPPTLTAESPLPSLPEVSETSNPDLPASPQPTGDTGFTLRTTSRLVDVAVVAFDKKGHPVTDLQPTDLQLYDNGRPQQVKYAVRGGEDGSVTAPPDGSHTFDSDAVTNRPNTQDAAPPGSTTSTVLMIDAGNVAFADLTYARSEMLRFLKTLPPGERVGFYVLGTHGFQVVLEPTSDHDHLASNLSKWMPSAQDLANAQDQERRNRQQFDWVHLVPDLAYVNGNGQGGNDPEMYTSGTSIASAMATPMDAELLPLGNRPEDFALHLLVGVGRHLAAIPGHKTLVWISSDNVLADWSVQAVGRADSGNSFLDGPAMRARETLNQAHVSIYPVDVSQLEASIAGADIGNRNIMAMGKTDRDASTARLQNGKGGLGDDTSPANRNGRDTARLQQDAHTIQGTFRDLATATGGRALGRAGDFAHELDSIVADGRAAWLLSFTPDTPADDKYHALTVKTTRPGVTLRFRTGYLYSKEPASTHDRLRQAVWHPEEFNEIGLVALPTRQTAHHSVRLSIAAADLALAQQAGRWMDRIDVFVVARDDSALHATVTGKQLGLALKPATYQQALKEGVQLEEILPRVLPGNSIRIIVIDENSRRLGTITLRSSD